MNRPQPAPLRYLLTLGLCLALIAPLIACGGGQRQKALRATLVGLNAARDGFATWDMGHQKAIVEQATTREEAELKLATYRGERATLVDVLELAYRALAAAATQSDEPSAKAALAAAGAALGAIRQLTGEASP